MGHLVRFIVSWLTTLSVFVSMATYYLAVNKTWQVKHERPVAASISIASYAVYLVTTTFFILNMLLTSAPWQTIAETILALCNTLFLLAIGLSWWVPGERTKGLWRLLSESLRSERRHLGALAKALTHPAGSQRIIDILTQVAMIDGITDDREKRFIQFFADSWNVRIDWDDVVRRAAAITGPRYAQLRHDVEAYLETTPPKAQALQLADLVVRLINADEHVTEAEALVSTELGALLEQYGEARDRIVYEVHLVPQSPQQAEAMMAAFPHLPRRLLASGPIAVAATTTRANTPRSSGVSTKARTSMSLSRGMFSRNHHQTTGTGLDAKFNVLFPSSPKTLIPEHRTAPSDRSACVRVEAAAESEHDAPEPRQKTPGTTAFRPFG